MVLARKAVDQVSRGLRFSMREWTADADSPVRIKAQ